MSRSGAYSYSRIYEDGWDVRGSIGLRSLNADTTSRRQDAGSGRAADLARVGPFQYVPGDQTVAPGPFRLIKLDLGQALKQRLPKVSVVVPAAYPLDAFKRGGAHGLVKVSVFCYLLHSGGQSTGRVV